MELLQTPEETTSLVIGVVLVVFVVLVGLFVYLLYRVLTSSSEEDQMEAGVLTQSMRRSVDLVVAIALVVVGLAGAVLGGLLVSLADRETIRDLVEEDTIQGDGLSAEELVDLVYTGLVWGGSGVVLTGILILLSGIAFAGYRRRLDRRQAASDESVVPSMASNALLGAVVAVVASFIPFSSVIGGMVAGYLQQEGGGAGLRVGALAGLFLGLPSVVMFGTVAIGLALEGLVTIALIVVLGILVSLIFSIGLTCVGGYAGGYIAAERADERRDRPPEGEPSREWKQWNEQRDRHGAESHEGDKQEQDRAEDSGDRQDETGTDRGK